MDPLVQPLQIISSSRIALELLIQNIHWVVFGVLVGMFFGVLPGLGGTVTISILLPFTLGLNRFAAFAMLSAVLGAVSFSGSIAAILANAPGTGGNAATVLDGYPLTRNGRAVEAIAAASFASASGALLGLIAFYVLIPVVIEIALLFGPSEIFWMVVIGLAILPLVAGDSLLAGMAVGGLGLLVAFTGRATLTGELRYTHGLPALFDGIGVIPPIVGLFAIAEMLRLAAEGKGLVDEDQDEHEMGDTGKIDGIRAVITHKWLWLKSSIIGVIVGAVPGIGGSVATFIAYGQAVSSSSNPDKFGNGAIEGIIASESANDAKEGGQLFPALGLGIPGSASSAVLLGGFIIHGIVPGPGMLGENLPLMLVIVFSLVASNILTSVIGLLFTRQFALITQIPISVLFPVIVTLSLTAAFVLNNSFLDMILALMFGIFGMALLYLNISRVPVVIAVILGPLFERNFQLTRQINDGVLTALFTGWLNWILIFLLIITIAYPIYQRMGKKRVGA